MITLVNLRISLKNDDLGLKLKILKFFGIQPTQNIPLSKFLYLPLYQNFGVCMPSHKYFSHDSDHVVHPGFLASMHKYKDHFKTLHAYYEKQRTDL